MKGLELHVIIELNLGGTDLLLRELAYKDYLSTKMVGPHCHGSSCVIFYLHVFEQFVIDVCYARLQNVYQFVSSLPEVADFALLFSLVQILRCRLGFKVILLLCCQVLHALLP